MCDCEELEFEDFETLLAAVSKKSSVPPTETPLVPLARTVAKRSK